MSDPVGEMPPRLGAQRFLDARVALVSPHVGDGVVQSRPERRLPQLARRPSTKVTAEISSKLAAPPHSETEVLEAGAGDHAAVKIDRADEHLPAGRSPIELVRGRQPALRPGMHGDIPKHQPPHARNGGSHPPHPAQCVTEPPPRCAIASMRHPGRDGEVRVHVDKTGKDMAPGGLDHLVGFGHGIARITHLGNPVAVDEQPAGTGHTASPHPDHRTGKQSPHPALALLRPGSLTVTGDRRYASGTGLGCGRGPLVPVPAQERAHLDLQRRLQQQLGAQAGDLREQLIDADMQPR
jgi:hypothetical protein